MGKKTHGNEKTWTLVESRSDHGKYVVTVAMHSEHARAVEIAAEAWIAEYACTAPTSHCEAAIDLGVQAVKDAHAESGGEVVHRHVLMASLRNVVHDVLQRDGEVILPEGFSTLHIVTIEDNEGDA